MVFPKPDAVVLFGRTDLAQNLRHGMVDPDFDKCRPHMLTAQGQHRFAALNFAYCKEMGLSISRGGELWDGGVFEGIQGESWLSRSRSNEANVEYPSTQADRSRSNDGISSQT